MNFQDKEVRDINVDDSIEYEIQNDKWGRILFTIGHEWEGEYLDCLHIMISQRPDRNDIVYRYNVEYDAPKFEVSSWIHKGFDHPIHMGTYYCQEHEIIEERWYPPDKTHVMEFSEYSSGIEIMFE